jgi:hypothetical protein
MTTPHREKNTYNRRKKEKIGTYSWFFTISGAV